MDFTLDQFTNYLAVYGSITLFVLLALGIIALPVPEETLMVFAGVLMSAGKLNIPYTVLAALGGSLCGITVSYLIGRTAGSYLIHEYGKWMGLTEAKLQAAHNWVEHYGKWSLFAGYFIPGVRHLTGVIAGTTGLDARQFMLFAYTGGFFWVMTFLSVGYFFGDYAFLLYDKLAALEFIDTAVLGLSALFLLYFGYIVLCHFKEKDQKVVAEKKESTWRRYRPLFVLTSIAASAALAAAYGLQQGFFGWMHLFMGFFLCQFAMLKLFHPSDFADGFRKYDLVAKRVRVYAYVYPLVELGLGLAYLSFINPSATYLITIGIMGLGAVGVILALRQGLDLKCACMGTILDVPLSTVTLSEDIIMGLMACWMLWH